MSKALYVESPNGRLYEVVTVPGFPPGDHGPCKCLFDHEAQTIAVSDTIADEDIPALIAGYFRLTSPGVPWSLVPVVGRVV